MSSVFRLLLYDSNHETSITFLNSFPGRNFPSANLLTCLEFSKGLIPVQKNSYTQQTFHLKLHTILTSLTLILLTWRKW